MTGRAARIAIRTALVAASILVVLAALEVTLRWRPMLLGQAFANGATSKYTTKPGGIFYFDPGLRMVFMIPNHTTGMAYNGYVWRHQTDALGFRNAPLHVPADVMLLGDSFVYGHGVELEHTLGYFLERRSGLRTVNLGQQATCAFQQAYVLTAYLPVFRPRAVVHVFTPNDIEDVHRFLSDRAMEAFIAQPLERITYPPRTDPATLVARRERFARERTLGKWAEQELYVLKMFRWIGYGYRQWRGVATLAVAEAAPARRRYDPSRISVDADSLGWRYTAHALAYMKHRAAGAGARLVMAPVVEGRQLEILRSIAARHAIDIVDTSELYAGPSFLPHDGHFSPHGAQTMARLIAAHLASR